MRSVAKHLSRKELASFLRADLSAEADAEASDHLRGGCLRCLLVGRRQIAALHAEARTEVGLALGGKDEKWRGISRRLVRVAWLELLEVKVSDALASELLARPEAERRRLLRQRKRYHLLGFAEWLSRRCRAEAMRESAGGIPWGEMAVGVAKGLDPGVYLSAAVARAQARAWCALGHARRVAVDLPGAKGAMKVAGRLLDGVSSEDVRLEYLCLRASLQVAEGEVRAARGTFAQARDLAVELGDREREAWIRLQLEKTGAGETARTRNGR